MEYFSACYRQKEDKHTSLLLQQYQYRHARIVFACICGEEQAGGAGGYMTERLFAWFRGMNLEKLIENREKKADMIAEGLAGAVTEADRELEEGGLTTEEGQAALSGILCVEEVCFILSRKMPAVGLINTAFGRPCLRRLGREERGGKLSVEQGSLEPDVALLLATQGFWGSVPEPVIKEALCIGEIRTEEQTEKHLAELGREAERRGGSGIGAVLVRTAVQGRGCE